MAGAIAEQYQSRGFSLGRSAVRKLIFVVVGTDDEIEVQALLVAAVPAVYLGLLLDGVDVEPEGGGIWKATARYQTIDNDNEYTFSTGGGTQKITQSLETVASYAPAGQTAADFQGAINVTSDGVEGVDIPVRQFEFSETHRFTDATIAGGFKRTLFLLTGTYNNATFKGFDAGECMFLGATGSKRGDELWSITFNFAGSPNVTGQTIGDITGIDKLGWHYLWVGYEDSEDSFAYKLVKKPAAVYVERVSEPADFSLLQIGTT